MLRAPTSKANLPGHAPPSHDGHDLTVIQSDAPAEEHDRDVSTTGAATPTPETAPAAATPTTPATAAAPPSKLENALALQEELAFLREEQAEACQVDLLLVDLDLRKIRVVGQVSGQALGHAVLHVDPKVAVAVIAQRRFGIEVCAHPANTVRLDLEIPTGPRHLETHERGGARHTVDTRRSQGDRDRREVDVLVLPPNQASQLQAPQLCWCRPVAERLERDLHLDRPATLEPPGPNIPDRIPVQVRIALVRELLIRQRTERCGVEDDTVAMIVVRVEQHAEVIVLHELDRVPTHLVCHPFARRRRVPQPGGNIHVVLVEHDPGLGSLGRRCALLWNLLNQAGDCRHRAIDLLAELAVHTNPAGQPDGPHSCASHLITCHNLGGNRRGGPMILSSPAAAPSRIGDGTAATVPGSSLRDGRSRSAGRWGPLRS